jgi:branched-chain amino acid transport system permease protein
MDYALHIGVLVAIFGVLALGQGLLLGYGNLLFVTQAAALGVGAYSWALLVQRSVPPEAALLLAAAAATIAIVPVGWPILRLTGDYLLVASLAICEVVRSFLNNTPNLTGGAQGLMGVPLLRLGSWTVSSTADYLIVSGAFLCLVIGGHLLVLRSPFGRLLRATGEGAERRDGEDAMRALGKPIRKTRLSAIAFSAATAGAAGALYASYITYLDPSQFTIWDSVLVLEMVVFGGLGTITGALCGVVAFVLIPEVLRFADMPSAAAGPLRQVLFASLLLIVLRLRPAGLFGRKDLAWLRA